MYFHTVKIHPFISLLTNKSNRNNPCVTEDYITSPVTCTGHPDPGSIPESHTCLFYMGANALNVVCNVFGLVMVGNGWLVWNRVSLFGVSSAYLNKSVCYHVTGRLSVPCISCVTYSVCMSGSKEQSHRAALSARPRAAPAASASAPLLHHCCNHYNG